MARMTRVEQQAHTRAAVLAAARHEFIEFGYGLAKIDRIAERAELTRGAVYSNFPSKRALYLAVLVDLVNCADAASSVEAPDSVSEALGRFARTWLERLPLVDDRTPGGSLQLRSLVGVFEDDHSRVVMAQLARLEALLLALGLEASEQGDPPQRRVRLAELTMTVLSGSSLLAEFAPGFGDPFDRIRAVEHLAGLDLADAWAPTHLPYIGPADACEQSWTAPTNVVDRITGTTVDLNADGLIVVLGAARAAAAEEAVRSAAAGDQITIVIVTSDPAETGNLVRLRISDLIACARNVFSTQAWGNLRLVIDDTEPIASALGVHDVNDESEAAARVGGGNIVSLASGRGAAYATAITGKGSRTQEPAT